MNPPNALRNFQLAFGQYVRNPQHSPCPSDIPPRRAQVYEELLFNNVCGFIDKCFPVSKGLFEDHAWTALQRAFFSDWRCHTPYFSKIPAEFVEYLSAERHRGTFPAWLAELAHYEWIELEVELFQEETVPAPEVALTSCGFLVNPTLHNLVYQWPVHRISQEYCPDQAQTTHLLVYRDPQFSVQFMEINALTALLIELANPGFDHLNTLLEKLIAQINPPQPETIITFGTELIDHLIAHNIFIGNEKCVLS